MAWSRVDKDEILIVAKDHSQVEREIAMFGDKFQQRHPVAFSEIAGDFYCWMDRRATNSTELEGVK